ncbi:PREDICTED: uncharacterized protein LOC105452235 [Wasmannia auropunctata]|uniref:uncharacterized protein LOC105452235 n=1 Tax=Wasmannia auropunctata TaxID=64793 RepID=UPI0005EFCA84|nr:PREDICTED: uncharacterized protein LOC105452235 [Wasmannia auropunctata]
MLQFMEEHSALAQNRLQGINAKKRSTELYQRLADLLNSCGNGATKSTDKWIKSWRDWRIDTKAKAAKIKNYQRGTGGGGPPPAPLLEIEERLISLMGIESIEGHTSVIDPAEPQSSRQCDVLNEVVFSFQSQFPSSSLSNMNNIDPAELQEIRQSVLCEANMFSCQSSCQFPSTSKLNTPRITNIQIISNPVQHPSLEDNSSLQSLPIFSSSSHTKVYPQSISLLSQGTTASGSQSTPSSSTDQHTNTSLPTSIESSKATAKKRQKRQESTEIQSKYKYIKI